MTLRDHYEIQLNNLRVECGEFKMGMEEISNLALLREINKRLMYLDCIPFTLDEIAKEFYKMLNDGKNKFAN
jgi:hypothetical protein